MHRDVFLLTLHLCLLYCDITVLKSNTIPFVLSASSSKALGYVSTWMGDRLSVLLVSLMALRLVLVDQIPFQPYYLFSSTQFHQTVPCLFPWEQVCEFGPFIACIVCVTIVL